VTRHDCHSLIIGGTRGIGRELAALLVLEGHVVSVIGRQIPELSRNETIGFWSADLLDEQRLAQTLKQVVAANGRLDNLIFLQRFKSAGDKWAGEIATSLSATRFVIERLATQFRDGPNKSIVLVSSIASRLVAEEQDVAYHVVKAGLDQLGRYYAAVLGPKGFRVNVVSPGTILKAENRAFYVKNGSLRRLFQRTIPLGRMGTALEVANVISFLCSPQASFVTGQTIGVDGGVNLLSPETLAKKLTGNGKRKPHSKNVG
jgi:NAD(P)-dependent dehydrogenase (short-subunit alcohol dehydrogenase family)